MDQIMKDEVLYEWFKNLPEEEQILIGQRAIAWLKALPEKDQAEIYRHCIKRMLERIGCHMFEVFNNERSD